MRKLLLPCLIMLLCSCSNKENDFSLYNDVTEKLENANKVKLEPNDVISYLKTLDHYSVSVYENVKYVKDEYNTESLDLQELCNIDEFENHVYVKEVSVVHNMNDGIKDTTHYVISINDKNNYCGCYNVNVLDSFNKIGFKNKVPHDLGDMLPDAIRDEDMTCFKVENNSNNKLFINTYNWIESLINYSYIITKGL